jgi:8-oxo-dGTP pyrophosphatase MutT (NUDIX family)
MKEFSYGICPYKTIGDNIYILLNKTHSKSSWNFFKGKIEHNETIVDTVIRELKEETNISISSSILEQYFFQTNKRKDIGIFLVDWNVIDASEMILDKKEIYSAKWFNIKDEIRISKNQSLILFDILTFLFQKLEYLKKIKN